MISRPPDRAGSRAVLIGCAGYRNLESLPTVTKGLIGVLEVLADPQRGFLDHGSVTLLTDPSAPAPVFDRLRDAAQAAQDTLLVYFSGHGLLNDRNDLYLALHDTKRDSLPHTALAYEQVREALLSSRAHNKIVVLDCCFAGQSIHAMTDPAGVVAGQTAIQGSYILTAVDATRTAFATDGRGHTAFTGALLDVLRTGDPDGPELFTLAYVFPRLKATLSSRNHPTPCQQGTDTVTGLALVRNPAHHRAAGPVINLRTDTTTVLPGRTSGTGRTDDAGRTSGTPGVRSGRPPAADVPSTLGPQPGPDAPVSTVPAGRVTLVPSSAPAPGEGGTPPGDDDPGDRPGTNPWLDGWRGLSGRRGLTSLGVALVVAAMIGTLIALAAPPEKCQGLPTDGEMSAVFSGRDGTCYGYTDTADRGAGFGDRLARSVQSDLFAGNQPLATGDLTVVWFGSLTCPPGGSYQDDGVTCGDGREYDVERQELEALKLAQHRTDLGGRIHVVIANAGADMAQAQRVTRLIADHRKDFGPRMIVIGGGDSRQETRKAITTLLDAHIPFIAPTMTADLGHPGRPFIDRPGFLQMSPPNSAWAETAMSFIVQHTPAAAHRKVIIFHAPVAGDEYTQSLALDAFSAAQDHAQAVGDTQTLESVGQLQRSVCRGSGAGRTLPAALFFADRWTTFKDFANSLTTLCGKAGPALLLSSDSVNRFLGNDNARAQVNAPWPLAYYRIGKQCTELKAAAAQFPLGEAHLLLTTAARVLGLCASDSAPLQIGDRISEFWDAITLATRITPADGGTGVVNDTDLAGATGIITVRKGQIATTTGTLQALCVLTVGRTKLDQANDAGRSTGNCDTATAFGPTKG